MYLPDITKLINDVQRSKIADDDRIVVCSAVQFYYKNMYEIGATNGKPVKVKQDNIVKKKPVHMMNRDELAKEATEQGIDFDDSVTHLELRKLVNGGR